MKAILQFQFVFFVLAFSLLKVTAQSTTVKFTIVESNSDIPITYLVLVFKDKDGNEIARDATDEKGEIFLDQKLLKEKKDFSVNLKEDNIYEDYSKNFRYEDNLKDITIKLLNRKTITKPYEPKIIISSTDLKNSGYANLGQTLHYLVPIIHSTPQMLSDLTDQIVPTTMNGLSSDHFTVLINEKRRQACSALNVNRTIGRGSVSTDLNSIPMSWIESIEILPTSASVKYGSDAIAGVINIKLKSNPYSVSEDKKIKIGGYINSGGAKWGYHKDFSQLKDGKNTQASLSLFFPLFKQGFLEIGGELTDLGPINRSGTYDFTSPLNNKGGVYFQGDPIKDTKSILANNFWEKTGFEGIDSLRFRVIEAGRARTVDGSLNFNLSLPFETQMNDKLSSDETPEFYAYGNLNNRQGYSSGFYRFPWDVARGGGSSLYPDGFSPKIESGIKDVFIVTGIKTRIGEFNLDVSNAYGRNIIDVGVSNSINAALGSKSPTSFKAGRFLYGQNAVSFDLEWSNKKNIQVSSGAMLRIEEYGITPGDTASYAKSKITSKESYSQVFPGIQPDYKIEAKRNNLGLFGLVTYYIPKIRIEINSGIRYERINSIALNFIDNLSFKGGVSWAVSKNRDFLVRGSFNQGFKAPSLAQTYFSSTSTQSSGIEVNQVLTVNSISNLRTALALDPLSPEQSNAFNIGADANIVKKDKFNILISLDAFHIGVNKRIILSGQIKPSEFNVVNKPDVQVAQVFLNALNSKTLGIVGQIKGMWKTSGWQIDVNGSLAILKNNVDSLITGLEVDSTISKKSKIFFDSEERNRLRDAQPRFKYVASLNNKFGDFEILLRATHFGGVNYINREVYTVNKINYDLNQQYSARTLVDIRVGMGFSDNIFIFTGINNIFDTYPDRNEPSILEANSNQFLYSRQTPQFDLTGHYFYTGLRLNL